MTSDQNPDHLIPPVGTDEAEARRQSFGAQAEAYTKYRPGYPAEVFDYLLEMVAPSDRRADVIDMGAGTGQLSSGFVERGCHVTAVDPDARMLDVLRSRTGVDAVAEGSAELLPAADRSADLIAGAQMWHWVDAERAVPEISRVLRPGGVLSIIWSLRDDSADWVNAMEGIVELPDSYKWFRSNDVPTLAEPFGKMALREFRFAQLSTPDDLVGLVGTFSHVALSDRRAEIEEGIRALTETHPQLAGRQTFEVPYVCKVFTVKKPAS